MDAALTAALDRVAAALETNTAATAQLGADILPELARILAALQPDEHSPVADALELLAQRVAALEATQGALVPGLREVVDAVRRRNGNAA